MRLINAFGASEHPTISAMAPTGFNNNETKLIQKKRQLFPSTKSIHSVARAHTDIQTIAKVNIWFLNYQKHLSFSQRQVAVHRILEMTDISFMDLSWQQNTKSKNILIVDSMNQK